MKKRVFSMLLSIILVVAGLNKLGGTEVKAKEYRNGYQLRAEAEEPSGVKINSSFLLTAEGQKKLTVAEVKEKLEITPKTEFDAVEVPTGIRIQPKEKLTENTVYAFAFAGATWLLQTESEFYLQAVLPAHQATEVPTDTGIEFVFSVPGAKDLEKYIEISPKVSGKFEQKGNLAVFLPSQKLKEKTVYTVKIKAGLPLADSHKTIKEDRAFQFETAAKASMFGEWQEKEYLNFQTWQNDIAVGDKPMFAMSYYNYKKAEKPKEISVKVELYRYPKAEDFMKALSEKANSPTWSRYADDLLAKTNLNRSMSIDAVMAYDEDIWGYRLELPTTVAPGYYLVEASKGKEVTQTFLQVTDISSFYQETDSQDVVWLHQVKTARLLAGAEITVYETADKEGKAITPKEIEKTKSDQDGIALLEKKTNGPAALLIRSGNMESVMFYRSWNYQPYYWKDWGRNHNGQQTNYWKVLQLDRKLYQPQDRIGIFGFVMPRYEKGSNRVLSKEERREKGMEISRVTAEITKDYWYFGGYSKEELAFAKIELPVKIGCYSGELELPNLAQGRYQLRIKNGEELLQTTYFRVEEYVKPAYKINVDKNKEAIFWNETIDFTVKTQFFEGTPVSNLDYRFTVFGQKQAADGQGKTDQNGQGKFTYSARHSGENQMQEFCQASVSAKLPESGEIGGYTDFRVFLRDVELSANAEKKDGKGIVSGSIYRITLERLNNGTAKDSGDFRDKPMSGHPVTAEIYENRWVRTEVGQYYDYINKVVRKQYEWHSEKKLAEKKALTTNEKGEFRYECSLKSEEDLYYTVELSCSDLSGNPIKAERYFWSSREWYYNDYEPSEEHFRLVKNKPSYKIGEMAELRLMKGKKEAKEGKVLYITAQNGYRQAIVAESKISLPFTEQEVPELSVVAVIFGGYAAERVAWENLSYNTQEKKLQIKATTDKDRYRPGDTVKLLLTVTDSKGEPAQNGKVLVKAVDEALLSLQDQSDNTLMELYRRVSDGLGESYSSHGLAQSFLERQDREMKALSIEEKSADIPMATDTVKEDSAMNEEQNKESTYAKTGVREKFLDTAVFRLADLDEAGKATLSFQMPDNITAWRMMLSAITEDLQAGSEIHNLNVSLPFFINTSLNTTYLEGDQLNIGVTGYGSQLPPDMEIRYQAFLDGKPIATAKARAFQRAYLDLPKFRQEGEKVLKIEAKAGDQFTDALQYKLNILSTHQQKMTVDVLPAQIGMQLKSNQKGLTDVMFLDREKSLYLPALYQLNYALGHRIDQRMVAKLAGEMLKEMKGSDRYVYLPENVKISEYQKENGGLSILPYAEEDVEITVHMLPLLIDRHDSSKDYTNRRLLQVYLERQLDNKKIRDKAKLFYGLAVLRTPMLAQLEEYEKIDNLSLSERIYLGLAYAELGDNYRVAKIYEQYVLPQVEKYQTVAFLKQEDKEESYSLTAIAMLLAQKINHPDAERMFRYVKDNDSKLHFVGAQKMGYIKEALTKAALTESKISYSYLGQDRSITLKEHPIVLDIPSQKLGEVKITDVKGNVDVVLGYPKTEKLAGSPDKYLHVTRKYLVNGKETNQFRAGDIVEVRLTWDIHANAPQGSYCISDFLPAGLKPVQNDFNFARRYSDFYRPWWMDVDGQRTSIYVRYQEKSKEEDRTCSYYARIVSGGEFQAEAVVMQGVDVPDHIYVGEGTKISIAAE